MTAAHLLGLGGYPDLPGFDKENRHLIYSMHEAGWTGRITSKRHWLAKAPDGKTTLTVPSKQGNNRGLKNAQADFMRWMRNHTSPEIKELWDKAIDENDPIVKDMLADSVVRKQAERVIEGQIERETEAIMEALKGPTVRPWLARKQPGKDGGTRYESEAVLEVEWPGGNIHYECAFPNCTYKNGNPRSVAAHYGKAHTMKGESPPAEVGPLHRDPAYTEPTTTREYRPTQRLVDALTEFMLDADYLAATPQELATLFLTWAHDRPDIEHTERPLVPLTDRQMLDKIRLIVGQPDQSEEIEGLKAENLDLANEVVRLKGNLGALRDLLDEG